jgi:hypothetical protein
MERFHALTEVEKQMLLDAPALITVLIAGAEGKIDHDEEERAKRAVAFRSITGDPFLFEYYQNVEPTFDSKVAEIVATYPKNTAERTQALSDALSKLNPVLGKLEKIFAEALVHNWKNLADAIARASGGFLGYFTISGKERKLIDLPMIVLAEDE